MRDRLFIDGGWCDAAAGDRLPIHDPATGEIIHTIAAAGAGDVDRAVMAAHAALPAWRRTAATERADRLDAIATAIGARAGELAGLSSRINGKPLAESAVDMEDAAGTFAYYAGLIREQGDDAVAVSLPHPDFSARVRREPVGVAGLITPWNFPLVTTAWKVAPALAAGCTAVLKPSEITAPVDLELGAIVAAAGLPAGVLNIVPGTGPTAGTALVAHPRIRKISFTGSTAVGERVMAAAAPGIKRVSLELGGKSAIIVFADADPGHAAELVAGGLFTNAGQMCSATGRLLVEEAAMAPLLERLVVIARTLRLGPGLDPASRMGPLTTAAQHATVLKAIRDGRESGARLLTGGGRPAHLDRGWFVEPTIFADVATDSALWRQEIFGPVLAVRSFRDEAEAVALANDSDYGLVATVVTADTARAERLSDALDVGLVWINSPQMVFAQAAWGGTRKSGIGRELGPWGLAAFQEIKHVVARRPHPATGRETG